MSGNVFNIKRFNQLIKRDFYHNRQLYALSTGAYTGVIVIVLSIIQLGNGLKPHDLGIFQACLIAFVSIFGILYVGHSFSAFRSKERAMTYLMTPCSHLEKFILEFCVKICLMILVLPVLYWITFHLQGYFFSIFALEPFKPVGIQYLTKLGVNTNTDTNIALLKLMIGSAIMFALSLAFTGSAIFSKQPLVKTLFAVAVIVLAFTGYSYIVLEKLGVGQYSPPREMWLIPLTEKSVFIWFSTAFIFSTLVMLFVAYRRLTEKEV